MRHSRGTIFIAPSSGESRPPIHHDEEYVVDGYNSTTKRYGFYRRSNLLDYWSWQLPDTIRIVGRESPDYLQAFRDLYVPQWTVTALHSYTNYMADLSEKIKLLQKNVDSLRACGKHRCIAVYREWKKDRPTQCFFDPIDGYNYTQGILVLDGIERLTQCIGSHESAMMRTQVILDCLRENPQFAFEFLKYSD
jgi:hypothetical protein